MQKLIKISCILALFSLVGFGYNRASAQILITNGKDTKPTDSVHTLLELRNDTSNGNQNNPSKSLLLPITDSARKRKLGQTPNFPQGAIVYDSSNRLIYVFSQGQWRALDTVHNKETGQPQSLDINQSDLENNPFGSTTSSSSSAPTTSATSVQPSSTAGDKNTLTIKTPQGYAPFEVKASGSSGGSSSGSQSGYPLVHITYNGISLTQDKDFKASLEGGGSGSQKKIKVQFLTLAPEDWQGFSSFSAEYVPLR